MAIRRCPYCKAIIDEADKYCNNCGTQLLFPEDEYVEEEIPGDKIIEEEEDEEEEEEEKEDGLESGEEEEEEDLFEEEEEGVGLAERGEAEEEAEEPGEEEESEEDLGSQDEEEVVTTEKFGAEEEELGKKYEVALKDDELIFKTKDLEGLTQSVDEGKKEVDRFIASARDKAQEEVAEEAEEVEGIAGGEETKEDLPPWASDMKGAPPAVLESEEEEAEEETTTTATPGQEWTSDSGIGVPEKVTQSSLAFTDTTEVEEETGEEDAYRKRQEKRVQEAAQGIAALTEVDTVAAEGGRSATPSPFSLRIKAKFVDLIFITALWLISLWFTAEVIGVSLFRLFAKSPLPVLGFYLILLLLYFFLFLYFLGETLGDHYFSEED